MLPIPENVLDRFNKVLQHRAVAEPLHGHYRKWLRYFLDFSGKYPLPESRPEQVRLFTDKLKSKKQTPQQCSQAAYAVSLFFESQKLQDRRRLSSPPLVRHVDRQTEAQSTENSFIKNTSALSEASVAVPQLPNPHPSTGGRRYNEWRCLEKSKSPAWDQAIEILAAEIKVRHYSRKTLKTYADWGRKFQCYLHDKPPSELLSLDVKNLTHLAVKQRVASSTQNQAFNALLFLFRHVLKKDFGDQRDVPRAKNQNTSL